MAKAKEEAADAAVRNGALPNTVRFEDISEAIIGESFLNATTPNTYGNDSDGAKKAMVTRFSLHLYYTFHHNLFPCR